MATKKPQLNVRLTDDLMALLPDMTREVGELLGQPNLSLPDVVAMGLILLRQWVAARKGARLEEVLALVEPAIRKECAEPATEAAAPPPKRPRGRPRKNPVPAEEVVEPVPPAEAIEPSPVPVEEKKPATKRKGRT